MKEGRVMVVLTELFGAAVVAFGVFVAVYCCRHPYPDYRP